MSTIGRVLKLEAGSWQETDDMTEESRARTVIRFSFCHLPSSSVKLFISHKTGMQTRKTRRRKTVNWVLSEDHQRTSSDSLSFILISLFPESVSAADCDCYDQWRLCLLGLDTVMLIPSKIQGDTGVIIIIVRSGACSMDPCFPIYPV